MRKNQSRILISLFFFLMFIFESQNCSGLNNLFFLSTVLLIEVKTLRLCLCLGIDLPVPLDIKCSQI